MDIVVGGLNARSRAFREGRMGGAVHRTMSRDRPLGSFAATPVLQAVRGAPLSHRTAQSSTVHHRAEAFRRLHQRLQHE